MKNIKFKLICVVFSFSSALAAQIDYNKYSSSDDILAKLLVDSNYNNAAWELSYIGEYKKMLEVWDHSERIPPSRLSNDELSYFSKFKAQKAVDFIKEKAKTEQIIIINEAHQQPYHRVFTTSILHELYEAGFRYFGAETITNFEENLKELEKNKFPTLKSGIYLKEPYYGNLVREAMNEGFKIFGYESTLYPDTIPGNRELEQAKNIKKILEKDPKAKILIHCGFDHLIETPLPSWGKAMAGRLTELTGINPFTIDQVKLTEHSSTEYNNPFWKEAELNYYALFIDSTGQCFYGPKEFHMYDARLYHPISKWISGRPDWVYQNGRTAYLIKKKITVSYPCLVFAYIAREKKISDFAIPFDVIELHSQNEIKALSLKKGIEYKIILRDSHSKEQNLTVKIK